MTTRTSKKAEQRNLGNSVGTLLVAKRHPASDGVAISPVESSLDTLASSTEMLRGAIYELTQRLTPVIIPAATGGVNGEGKTAADTSVAPIQARINSINYVVTELTADIRSTLVALGI